MTPHGDRPGVVVRPAAKEDRASWIEMRHALWPGCPAEEHESEVGAYFAGGGRGLDGALLAFGEPGGAALGLAELSIRSYAEGCETDRVAYLEGWYVRPEARRQGVGRALVRAAEAWGRERGCREMGSDTDLPNEVSAAAHRALGFEDAGTAVCFFKRLAPPEGASGAGEAVRESYDRLARSYADTLYDELARKPLDRHLLDRFVEEMRALGGPGISPFGRELAVLPSCPGPAVADVGCGPGQVGRYLRDRGLSVLALDVSLGMLREARRRDGRGPAVAADLESLALADGALAGIVAFYALVHAGDAALARACRELRRVLRPRGALLLSFHVGDETVHRDELFGERVDLSFRFLPVRAVTRALEAAGLRPIEVTEREPYEGVEHPSRRAYVLARRAG